MNKFIGHFFGFFLIFAIAIGFFWPVVSQLLRPHLRYFLMIVLFFNFLRLDYHTLSKELKKWPYQLYLLLLSVIGIPLLIYGFALTAEMWLHFSPEFVLGFLLIFGVSTASIAPTLCLLIHGRFERALLHLVLSSFLVPITLPLLFFLLEGSVVHLPWKQFTVYLATLIFIPFFAALFFRWMLPKVRKSSLKIAPLISLLCFMSIVTGIMIDIRHYVLHHPMMVFYAFLLSLVAIIISLLFSYLFSMQSKFSDKATAAILSSWKSMGLSLIIANAFFRQHQLMILFLTVTVIAYIIMSLIVTTVFRHYSSTQSPA